VTRIRVLTDSACDLPEDVIQRLDIDVVSLTIRFGDQEYVDRVDLTPSAFWAKCKSSKTLPETAAPSPGAFQAGYERAKADGCDGVLVLTLSAALSATHNPPRSPRRRFRAPSRFASSTPGQFRWLRVCSASRSPSSPKPVPRLTSWSSTSTRSPTRSAWWRCWTRSSTSSRRARRRSPRTPWSSPFD